MAGSPGASFDTAANHDDWKTSGTMSCQRFFPPQKCWEVIHDRVVEFGYRRYLEIGIKRKKCFRRARGAGKESVVVEAASRPTYAMPSDEFFARYPDKCYDLIFIDGLQEAGRVRRDILHALARITAEGMVGCHDVNPMGVSLSAANRYWNTWEAFAELRCGRAEGGAVRPAFRPPRYHPPGCPGPVCAGAWERTRSFPDRRRNGLMRPLPAARLLDRYIRCRGMVGSPARPSFGIFFR